MVKFGCYPDQVKFILRLSKKLPVKDSTGIESILIKFTGVMIFDRCSYPG